VPGPLLNKLDCSQWLQRLVRVLRLVPFLLPSAILLGVTQRPSHEANSQWYFGLGAGLLLVAAVIVLARSVNWRYPASPAVVMFHLTALGWLTFGTRGLVDWYVALSQSVLLIIPLLLLAYQTLRVSGVMELRRAQLLAEAIERRPELPTDAALCRELPEVKAFRDAIHNDPTPAMTLLQRGTAAVQVAALCALESHRDLRPGQAELILRLAQKSQEPAVRAAAVRALGNVQERELVEKLADFLRDRAQETRQATATALLCDLEHRWAWVRPAVQEALADPALVHDGALWASEQPLGREVVADLHGWTAAGGPLGARAAATLATHYRRALVEQTDPGLVAELRRHLLNFQMSVAFRHELAQLLYQHDELTTQDLEELLRSGESAPLRLFAADALLARGEHLEAVDTLRELAHVPNRELAVATAAIVQRRLGVDLGLNLDASLPALHTRQAADITRRVMRWAAEQDAVENGPERISDAATFQV
jgi:hypothetical protein